MVREALQLVRPRALNCKVVLGHILSGIEFKDRPSGLESENGAQARDHTGQSNSRLASGSRSLLTIRSVGERK